MDQVARDEQKRLDQAARDFAQAARDGELIAATKNVAIASREAIEAAKTREDAQAKETLELALATLKVMQAQEAWNGAQRGTPPGQRASG